MNKLGICEWTMPITGPYVCKFVKQIGYDGLQLLVGWWAKRFEMSKKATQQAYLEMAAEHGVEFASITARETDFYCLYAPEGSEDREIIKTSIVAAIEAAEALGIDIFMLPTFGKSEPRSSEDMKILTETLRWACDLAADAGVTVAAENLLTVEDVTRLLDAVDRENLGLYFDLQNYYLNRGWNTPQMIEPLLPRMVQVHAKDGKNGDLSGAPLGEGDVDLFGSLNELKRLGYEGWIVNENYYDVPPLVREGDDPVEKLRNDLATLRKSLG